MAVNNVDWNQLTQTILTNVLNPATIAALIAAAIAWHNRSISKDTNLVAKDTKVMVNGRMDQLLAAAQEIAEMKGRKAADDAAVVLKAATDKAIADDRLINPPKV